LLKGLAGEPRASPFIVGAPDGVLEAVGATSVRADGEVRPPLPRAEGDDADATAKSVEHAMLVHILELMGDARQVGLHVQERIDVICKVPSSPIPASEASPALCCIPRSSRSTTFKCPLCFILPQKEI